MGGPDTREAPASVETKAKKIVDDVTLAAVPKAEMFDKGMTNIERHIDGLAAGSAEEDKDAAKKFAKQIKGKERERLTQLRDEYLAKVKEVSLMKLDPDVTEEFKEKVTEFVDQLKEKYAGGTSKKWAHELSYFIDQGKMEKAKDKPLQMHKVATDIVINYLTRRDKIGESKTPLNKQMVEGLAPYIAKQLGDLAGFESGEDLAAHIEEQLTDDKNIMKEAMKDLAESVPQIRATSEETSFVRNILEGNKEFEMYFGEAYMDQAVDVIAKQLEIVFDGKGKPVAYVNMLSGRSDRPNLNHTKVNEAGMKEVILKYAKEIKAKNKPEALDEYQDELTDREDAVNDRISFLTEGHYWNGVTGEAIDEIADLEKGRPTELVSLLTDTKQFRGLNEMNEAFKNVEGAAELLANNADNPAVMGIARSAASSGLDGSALADLFKLISDLLTGKLWNNDVAKEIKEDLDAGKNPVEKAEKSRMAFAPMLIDAPLGTLLTIHKEPGKKEHLTALAEKAKVTLPETISGIQQQVLKDMVENRIKGEFGADALTFKEHKSGDLAGSTELVVTRGEDKFTIIRKPDGVTTFQKNEEAVETISKEQATLAKLREKVTGEKAVEAVAEKLPKNEYIENGILKKSVIDNVHIEQVLKDDGLPIETAEIKTEKGKRKLRAHKGPRIKGGETIKVERRGKTFVMTEGRGKNKRLYVYPGDEIVSINRKKTPVVAVAKIKKGAS